MKAVLNERKNDVQYLNEVLRLLIHGTARHYTLN